MWRSGINYSSFVGSLVQPPRSAIEKNGGDSKWVISPPPYQLTNNRNPMKECENDAIEQIDVPGAYRNPGPGCHYRLGAYGRICPGGRYAHHPHRRPASRPDRGHEAGQTTRNEGPV